MSLARYLYANIDLLSLLSCAVYKVIYLLLANEL